MASPAPPVSVWLFGPVRILAGDVEIDVGLRTSARALLAALAVHREGTSAQELMGMLWPDSGDRQARSLLTTSMSNLRAQLRAHTGLHDAGFVLRLAGRYQLDPTRVEVDLWTFTDALARAAAADDAEQRRRQLRTATGLYRGQLCAGSGWEWVQRPASAVSLRAAAALSELAAMHAQTDPQRALGLCAQALTIDPYAEPIYRQCMRIQARLNQPAAAAATYQRLRAQLADLGAPPTAATEQLARRLLHPAPPAAVPQHRAEPPARARRHPVDPRHRRPPGPQ